MHASTLSLVPCATCVHASQALDGSLESAESPPAARPPVVTASVGARAHRRYEEVRMRTACRMPGFCLITWFACRKWSRHITYLLPSGTSEFTATMPVYALRNVPSAMSTAQRTPQPRGAGEPSGFWWRKICSGRKGPGDVTLHAEGIAFIHSQRREEPSCKWQNV